MISTKTECETDLCFLIKCIKLNKDVTEFHILKGKALDIKEIWFIKFLKRLTEKINLTFLKKNK